MIIKKRKAVSPLVSTVLLIMIVVVLALIIIIWSGVFLSEAITKEIGGEKKLAEAYCREISLQTFINPDSFGFKNNGNVPIYSYKIKLSSEGSSEIKEALHSDGGMVNPGYSTIVKDPNTGGAISYDLYEEVKLIPVILAKSESGADQQFTCPESSGVIV